ncbi:hypothetical protein SAMN06295967_1252 [Belliella buryatensis]|uniref:Uncharacterized protein n=1 Tax=Belliella buryatensis TaxID=1500549 RepID=A0A239H5J9_9BACT|nr:hypothetical protein [Belliella buryatensis]SNS76298.1 hypothetical protein SAMN06295967_1252 [Belliella buryatensis]
MKKLNDKIRTEKDTLYIFSNDFFKEVEGITEKENEVAQKLLSFIGTNKDDEEEIMLVLQPRQLYHFLINIQRNIQKQGS